MNEQEINYIIAEYMGTFRQISGTDPVNTKSTPPYTTSLDACIPVVEKLSSRWDFELLFFSLDDTHIVNYGRTVNKENWVEKSSPALTLATALAEAIKSLKEA